MSQAAIRYMQSDTPPPAVPLSLPQAPQVGSVIDSRYRLLREIACGGGGVVFEAEHVHTRARVALKAVNFANAAVQKRVRILREARALGRASHPNIVHVLDAGECRRHGPFVVLSLVEGRTLESFISSRGRLDVATTAAVIAQLADALHLLGRRGVVHRDVKPSNVLVSRGVCGRSDTAILIDFGVAKVEEEVPVERITIDGDLVGTPEYMAPEQISAADIVDHRTDVYGLGALAYECLTGSPPFTGPALAVVSSIIVGATPQPISRYRSDVPVALEAAVLRALEREPAKRWLDAAAFGRACSAAVGGTSTALYLYPPPVEGPDSGRPNSVRRKTPRIPYQAPARVLVGPRAGYDARLEDISSAGALLTTAAALLPQTQVSVRFPLPMSGIVVTVEATTRWVKTRGQTHVVGVEFVRPSAEVRREIDAFSALRD
ncbi:MAG: serine/threonine-protein kinase [Polyangiaceae bacterium]